MKDLMKSISYAIMFERVNEFKIIIKQSSELVQNIKDTNLNSLIHIIVCREKLHFLKILIEIFEIQNSEKSSEEKRKIFNIWINQENIKNNSALNFAVQKSDLVF